MKVTINKETGLGEVENPFAKQRQIEYEPPIYTINEDWCNFDNTHPQLPVISQSGEILAEGTWGCEKVWQFRNANFNDTYHKDKYWLDMSYRSKSGSFDTVDEFKRYCHEEGYNYRQIYRVVLPTQPDVKETVSNLDIGEPRSLGIANGIDPCPFCGAKEGEGVILGQRNHLFMITCTNCGVQTQDDRKDKVQSHWNRRSPDSISKQQVLAEIEKYNQGSLTDLIKVVKEM